MPQATGLLGTIARVFRRSPRTAEHSNGERTASLGTPGQFGPEATSELDPRSLHGVHMEYSPVTDGDPDPGEIVWTWVPYEERDGRGKDRPVLIVGTLSDASFLAVQLTSKDHDGDRPGEYVQLGTGDWDGQGRPSWANIDRVFRAYASGMRREAAALDPAKFLGVAQALNKRYGWN